MTLRILFAVGFFALIGSTYGLPRAHAAEEQEASLKLTLFASPTSYFVLEPVYLGLDVTNTGKEFVSLDHRGADIALWVQRNGGAAYKFSWQPRETGIRAKGRKAYPIAIGPTRNDRRILIPFVSFPKGNDPEFLLDNAGSYTLWVTLRGCRSNDVLITVKEEHTAVFALELAKEETDALRDFGISRPMKEDWKGFLNRCPYDGFNDYCHCRFALVDIDNHVPDELHRLRERSYNARSPAEKEQASRVLAEAWQRYRTEADREIVRNCLAVSDRSTIAKAFALRKLAELADRESPAIDFALRKRVTEEFLEKEDELSWVAQPQDPYYAQRRARLIAELSRAAKKLKEPNPGTGKDAKEEAAK